MRIHLFPLLKDKVTYINFFESLFEEKIDLNQTATNQKRLRELHQKELG